MPETKRNASVNFASFSALDQRRRLQLNELQRIQNKLEELLSRQEAQEIAAQIHDIVLEVDEEIDQILEDPLVRKLYEFDGRFFTPKYRWGFHRAFDGVHILTSLSDDIIETFFDGKDTDFAIQWLMYELGKHRWEAKLRRMNWEESGTLSLVPKEVLDEIMRRRRQSEIVTVETNTPLSVEEGTFFQFFEDQMAHIANQFDS